MISKSKRDNGQGQSELVTEEKQRGLQFAFIINTAVIRKTSKWNDKPYQHFDLNAGNGYNDKAKCVGSPVTFMLLFRDIPNFRATFIDCDKAQIEVLAKREIMQDARCSMHHGDNAEFLRNLRINGNWQFGSILSDPNGTDVPFDELQDASERYPQIDQIFHWNSNITKRLKYGIKPNAIMLSDVPKLITKSAWLIRKPLGRHQFAMLIGRNYRGKEWVKGGFYYLDSEMGEKIMDECCRSTKDRDSDMAEGIAS